ncbi:MAG TPA: DNA primase small subunit domain-containing protein [Streptosporangiaceae bacterium]|nr:DNA primase small subunit domain-containing protein [Streptosporangiaceae bacterium]
MPDPKESIQVAGRQVLISNPGKVYFPHNGKTKLDIVRYYLSVADGALRAAGGRPMVLKRFVNGADAEAFFQKRAPSSRPDWIETVELSFPSGRTAEEVVINDAAGLAWVANLGCIDLNPHPVRAADTDHPDELRVDLDPVPGVPYQQILDVAMVAREVLADFGLTGWPKTSGSRGFHIYARIEPRWTFTQVRACAVALAREIERRAPDIATSRWWKEERHGVFVDYNQNAKDRTVASGYSIRPTPDARVSAPLAWDEVPACDPAAFTIDTVPARFAEIGDPWAGIDAAAGSLEPLLELAGRDQRSGLPDAPWPPHFTKAEGEAPRVQPSKRRSRVSSDGSPPASMPATDGPAGTSQPAGTAGPGRTTEPARTTGSAHTAEPARTTGSTRAAGPARTTGPTGAAGSARAAWPSAVPSAAPGKSSGPTGRRRTSMPLIEVARAASQAEALAGLDRWKARHPQAAACLEPADILVDSMRGRSSTWTRIRLNLRHVPADRRPPQEALEVDYDPWRGVADPRRRPGRDT